MTSYRVPAWPGPPEHRDHLARRPWEDDPGRRDAAPGRARSPRTSRSSSGSWTRASRSASAGSRSSPRTPRSRFRARRRRAQDQHRRHPRARRLRRRGRAGALDGRRRAAPGRRLRGAAPADALRAPKGAGARAAADPRRQQGGPSDARLAEVVDAVYDLFLDLDATRSRSSSRSSTPPPERDGRRSTPRRRASDLAPLFTTLSERIPAPSGDPDGAAPGAGNEPRRLPLLRPARRLPRSPGDDQAQRGDRLVPARRQRRARSRIAALYVTEGLERVEVEAAGAGEIVVVAGMRRGHDRRDDRRARGARGAAAARRGRARPRDDDRRQHLAARRRVGGQAHRATARRAPATPSWSATSRSGAPDRGHRRVGGAGQGRAPAGGAGRDDAPRGLRADGGQAARR